MPLEENPKEVLRQLRRAETALAENGAGKTATLKLAPEPKTAPVPVWNEPVPFDDVRSLPSFPDEALPPVLRDWARATATDLRVPIELPAMMALACVATAAAKCMQVEVKPGWEEPLNIYTVIALRSGETKSPAQRRAVRPIHRYERELRDRRRDAIRDLQDRITKTKAKEAKLKLRAELDALKEEASPQLLVDDCTPEALAIALAHHHERMGLVSSEGGIFDTLAGRYSAAKTANLDLFNKAYSGDPVRVNRVGREAVALDEPALTVALCVQPHVVQELAAKPGFRGTGFLARFFYSLPSSMVGTRVADPPPVPSEIDRAYDEMLMTLLTALTPKSNPPRLRLSEDAQTLRSKFQTELEPRLAEYADLGAIADFGNKLVGNIARIAGLLHLATHARLFGNPKKTFGNTVAKPKKAKIPAKKNIGNIGNNKTTFPSEITANTFADATKIGEYLLQHALAAFSLMGSDPRAANAKHALSWIQRERLETFEHRTVHQAVKGTIKRVEDLDAALFLLVDHGYLKEVPKPWNRRGRPPKPSYSVNPCCHNSHNSQKAQPAKNNMDWGGDHNSHNPANGSLKTREAAE